MAAQAANVLALGPRLRLLLTAALCVAAVLVLAGAALAAPRLYEPSYFGFEGEAVGGFDAAGGTLTPLAGSPFQTAPSPSPAEGIIGLAFAPDGGRAVANYLFKNTAQGLSVDGTGAISPAGSPVEGSTSEGLAVSPDGRFAYVATRGGAGRILGFSLAADGALSSLGPGYGGGSYGDVAITPDGRYLFAVLRGSGIERFAIEADGSLAPLGTTEVEEPTHLTVSPDGRLLFVGRTSSGGDGIASFAVGAGGELSEIGEATLPSNALIRYFAVSPDGRHLYLPDSNNGVIDTIAVAAEGSLSLLRTTELEQVSGDAVSPDGRFLYYELYDEARGEQGIGVATLAADGTPTPTSAFAAWPTGEEERLIFAPGSTPTAAFSAVPAAPGAATSFDAGTSTGAVRYDWDFGDGTVLEDGGPTPSHVYASPGSYTATLTVTDANGCSSEQIYTGQSTVCPGGAQATAVNTVQIAQPPTPPAVRSPATTSPVGTPPATTSPAPREPATTPRPAKPAPRLKALRVSNHVFADTAAGKEKAKRRRHLKRSTIFRYRLSEPAKVTFTVSRKVLGRRVGGRCRRRTRANRGRKRCVLGFRRVGSPFARNAKRGAERIRFAGKVPRRSGSGRRRLRPGVYRVTAVAIGADGRRSRPRRASFRIAG